MNWRAYKPCTEILVPWIGLLGLVVGAIFGVLEYQARQHEQAVAAVLQYTNALQTNPIVEARRVHDNVWLGKLSEMKDLRRRIGSEGGLTEKAWNDYMVEVVRTEDLRDDFLTLAEFYESLSICVNSGICDKSVAFEFFGPKILSFRNIYYPYIQKARDELKNPTYLTRLLHFADEYAAFRKGPK